MVPVKELISCSIIEKDNTGNICRTWTYPAITESQETIVIRKSQFLLEGKHHQLFVFARHKDDWFYIHCKHVGDSNKLPGVKLFALVLFTKDLNPKKYEALATLLSNRYVNTGKPTELLQLYLGVFTKGTCNVQENGIFDSDYFNRRGLAVWGDVRDLIKTFELETILIYTALLLKKRIIVYHHSLEELLESLRTFPTLMKHRNVVDSLFPWVDLNDDELAVLKKLTLQKYQHYVAGCRNGSISSRTELYDLFVNLPAREITIASHAKESLTMTKNHKEIALFMIQLCDNQSYTGNQIASEIADKTQDLLNQLKTMATVVSANGEKSLSASAIKSRNLPPAVENFLINLAVAENLFII